ncbi:hypothetical protein HRbin34_00481 [bacterium HR34]|nr:hypothetical protein HRbin34_00481 [bacterium HR34]
MLKLPLLFIAILISAAISTVSVFYINKNYEKIKYQEPPLIINTEKGQLQAFVGNQSNEKIDNTKNNKNKNENEQIKKEQTIKNLKSSDTKSENQNNSQITQHNKKLSEKILQNKTVIDTSNNKELKEPQFCKINKDIVPPRTKIIFNEINWAGSKNSAYDEWIELKNVALNFQDVSIKGWQIISEKGNIKIIIDKDAIIKPLKFYLIVSDKSNLDGDFKFKGNIRNEGDSLYLFDENCKLQDSIIMEGGWFYGDNNEKLTMERTKSLEWKNSKVEGGTPNFENSVYLEIEEEQKNNENNQEQNNTQNNSNQQSNAQENSEDGQEYKKLLIVEIQIKDETNSDHDFVKIFNPSEKKINLDGINLVKKSSTGKTYSIKSFGENDFINPKEYIVWKNSDFESLPANYQTTQTLSENNSIAIIKKDKGEIIDSVCWGEGENQFKEGDCLPNPYSKLERKKQNNEFIDTQNNLNDFTYDQQSPNNQNSENQQQKNQNQQEQQDQNNNQTYNYLDVVFSEIAWAGTKASSYDEWIELFNNTQTDIDLSGWKIKGEVKGEIKLEINLQGTIKSGDYFLLERTDDNTISNIQADLIFTGNLLNSGMNIRLLDPQNNIIDELSFENGWPAGDNDKKLSMERKNLKISALPDNFQSFNGNFVINPEPLDAKNNKILGTPKHENSK